MRNNISERKFMQTIRESVPPVEEIERLMEGNCHHGMLVPLCKECSTGRLFEATVKRAAEALGLAPDDAAVYAAGALADIQAPRCSHEGCKDEARWRASFRLSLLGAGEASGTYEGEIDGGGLCLAHRNSFDPKAWKEALVERVCQAYGISIPADAQWSGSVTWAPITPRSN